MFIFHELSFILEWREVLPSIPIDHRSVCRHFSLRSSWIPGQSLTMFRLSAFVAGNSPMLFQLADTNVLLPA